MSTAPGKTITVELRDVYGIPMVYPVCTDAKVFAAIAGTKTLTRTMLVSIEMLGYSILCAPRHPQVLTTGKLNQLNEGKS